MTTTEYIAMSDCDLRALYDLRRRNGDGDVCGDGDQAIAAVIAGEGWDAVRDISDRPDVQMWLALDGDACYIVGDVYGPWAIQLTYADGSDRLAGPAGIRIRRRPTVA